MPSTSVVVAAFGMFEPSFLGLAYQRARSLVSRNDMLGARASGAAANLAALLPDANVLPVASELLEAVAPLDGTARPLFSALRELSMPDDPHGRLWRAVELIREHRGDGHLAAGVAAGLGPVSMNVLTESWIGYDPGEYMSTRGYSERQLAATLKDLERRGWVVHGELSAQGLAARRAIENATDRSQDELIDRLGSRIESLIEQLGTLSDRLVAANAAPTDPRKRAAG